MGALASAYAALAVFLAVGVLRSGLRMSADGIVVRSAVLRRTVELSEATGFVALPLAWAPCPVLQRTHGRPLPVRALGRGLWRARFPLYVQQLEPLCDQLNALLKRLQAEAPGTVLATDGALIDGEVRNTDHTAAVVLLGGAVLFWLLAGVVVALHPTAVVVAAMAAMSVAETIVTWMTLRRIRGKDIASDEHR